MTSSIIRTIPAKKLLLATVATATLFGGVYASYWIGLQRGLQTSAYAHAIHIRNELTTLKCLQAKQLPQAHSMLETSLAAGIILIGPEGKFLTPRTERAVLDVLGEAKAYREKYPWSGYSSEIAERVERVLSAVEAKPSSMNCQ